MLLTSKLQQPSDNTPNSSTAPVSKKLLDHLMEIREKTNFLHQDYMQIYQPKNLTATQDKKKEYIKQHDHNQTNAMKSKPILQHTETKYEALNFDLSDGEVKSLSFIFKNMSELEQLLFSNNNLTDKKLAVLLDALRQNPNCEKLNQIVISQNN